MGGIDTCIEEILQLIAMPLKHPEVYLHLGIQPPRGILLHGPPGCGKTMLANAIAGEIGVPFVNISAPSIVSGMSGESEKKIREVFEEAKEIAPCLIFIDEIDAITPKRETAQREMERRIVAQLLTCLDDISVDMADFKPIIVIGATNRPDSLDPALRRAGRFDREISIGVPDEAARGRILEKMCSKLRLEGNFNFQRLARLTPGYVGADLGALTAEAGMIAVRRIFKNFGESFMLPPQQPEEDSEAMDIDMSDRAGIPEAPSRATTDPHQTIITSFLSMRRAALSEIELNPLCIQQEDFVEALAKVQPSSKREGFATVPDVSWENVGALEGVRDELRMAIVEPIKRPEFFKKVGINKPMGVVLYGPPGCGKTLLAKAVANESCCNFISVKGPELLNKVRPHFSERGIRQVFARAAASSPCIIFFDELDAICPARSNDSENQSSSRLVNTLLTELDGMQGRSQVYIIAATNRPDMIDPRMLRPGRLDKTLYVDLPIASERYEILKTITRSTPLSKNVDLNLVATDSRCEGFSGADLAALVREAAVAALRSTLYAFKPSEEALTKIEDDGNGEPIWVTLEHFNVAFSRMAPSVSKRDKKRYELLKVRFSAGSSAGVAPVPEVVPGFAQP
ncbi:P-loop containing nucleoside triphosphate hydrolase protein [Chytridium lagenaria]|nr:P-loop containing nucleoside triphosphate hydrolase protein [Chytridium lagenaria]